MRRRGTASKEYSQEKVSQIKRHAIDLVTAAAQNFYVRDSIHRSMRLILRAMLARIQSPVNSLVGYERWISSKHAAAWNFMQLVA